MRTLNARKITIAPRFFPQHEIDPEKVDALEQYIRSGGEIAPVVVARYGDQFMPIDGHHRLEACARMRRQLEAWVVPGDKFEDLDRRCREERDLSRAEDFVMCNGVPALQVAPRTYIGETR
jgi:ParB-like chromosome segregation protein Spo0J